MHRHTLIFVVAKSLTVEIDLVGAVVTPRCLDQIEACVECDLVKGMNRKAAHVWLCDGREQHGLDRAKL